MALDSETALQIADTRSTEDSIEQQEAIETTKKVIRKSLSKEEQYILKRHIFENASHKEIASELGITVWTSQKRLERIRDKLRKNFPGDRD